MLSLRSISQKLHGASKSILPKFNETASYDLSQASFQDMPLHWVHGPCLPREDCGTSPRELLIDCVVERWKEGSPSHSFSMKASRSQGDYKCMHINCIWDHESWTHHSHSDLCVLWHLFWMCQSVTLFSLFLADILSGTLARGSCLWIPIVENSSSIPWATV